MIVHGVGDAKERKAAVQRLADVVGLSKAHLQRYPHQFSGANGSGSASPGRLPFSRS